jgi:chromosome segregation ATPase
MRWVVLVVDATPVALTSGALAVAAMITALTPIYLRYRNSQLKAASESLVSWEGLTHALQEERDRLQVRLDESERHFQERTAAIEADWAAKLEVERARITDLNGEITRLKDIIQRLRGDV